jgi:GT2 family glycosyltransferase
MNTVEVIIPTYGALDYAVAAAESCLTTCKVLSPSVTVIDDASPEMQGKDDAAWDAIFGTLTRKYPRGRFDLIRNEENEGLTACWNLGLYFAACNSYDYAICGNSDIIFTPGWDIALVKALETLDLVGSVTNAPGTEVAQDVSRYSPELYQLTDNPEYLAKLAQDLHNRYGGAYIEKPINGFFMMAKTSTWWNNRYDITRNDVFRPRNDFNSKGQRNPTPLMTLNEYEFQARLRQNGGRVGFCPGSFVFHYRAVSRGDAYKRGKWYRKKT